MLSGTARNKGGQLKSWFKKINNTGRPQLLAKRAMSSSSKSLNLVDGESFDFSKDKYDAVIIGGGHNGLV